MRKTRNSTFANQNQITPQQSPQSHKPKNSSIFNLQGILLLSSLELENSYISNNIYDSLIANENAIQKLKFSGCKFQNFTDIIQLKTIAKLDLSSTNISDEEFHCLGTLSNLTSLNIANCIDIHNFWILNSLYHLKEFDASSTKLTNHSLTYLSQKLKSLILEKCYGITDKGLSLLKRNLIHLNISSNQNISEKGIGLISEQMKNLYDLDISHCINISNKSLRYLKKMKKLKFLDISHTGLSAKAIGSLLQNLPSLQFLGLDNLKIFDEDLDDINVFLNIEGTEATSDKKKEIHKRFKKLPLTSKIKSLIH